MPKYILLILILWNAGTFTGKACALTSSVDTTQVTTIRSYIIKHPNEAKSLRLLKGLSFNQDYIIIAPLYKLLGSTLKQSPAGLKFGRQLEGMKNIVIGAAVPGFSAPDTSGQILTLSQFKGSFVLLDFWASWCVPCRQGNPALVKLYSKFKAKNFVIIGVSLDRKREAWIKAIKADGLAWHQVSDLQYWDNTVAKLFGVQAIPQSFLIGPDGKLIAKNLRGDTLNAKLVAVLAQVEE
jgi:peroxiredoxin